MLGLLLAPALVVRRVPWSAAFSLDLGLAPDPRTRHRGMGTPHRPGCGPPDKPAHNSRIQEEEPGGGLECMVFLGQGEFFFP